ncbi:MAG: adenosylcobinamide-GDP ribazoletransferase [Solirubrobacteraceae bacterium]
MPTPARRATDGALAAITFLTILPVPRTARNAAASAPRWFALVGGLIGAAAAGIYAACEPLLGPTVAAVLALVTLVLITGGLHLDGLADCADGLGVRGDRTRRLAVMREAQIGSFGALALLLWGLLLTTSLAQMPVDDAVAALICAPAAGRWAAVLHGRWAAAARTDGLGAAFAPSWTDAGLSGLNVAALACAADLESAAPVVLAAALVALLLSSWSRCVLGGRTGDTLGATVVLAELAVVLVLAAFARG